MRDDEAVDDVELRCGSPVHADDDALLDDELGLRIEWPVGRDQAELGQRRDERLAVEVALSRETNRRLRIGEEPSFRVRAGGFPHEVGRASGSVGLELRGPVLELRGRGPTRAKSRVDSEQEVVWNGGELGGAFQARREWYSPCGAGDLGLERERIRGRANLGAVDVTGSKRVQRDVRQRQPAGGRRRGRAAGFPVGSRASDRSPCRQTLGWSHT